ncbi:MAG: YicC family protein [Muribaculaceae bacterium]|nr:YicC family protein [Muribaculaceae bacterium]
MILSMTGFGKAVTICGNKQITAEIKSLNSKQMDLLVRMPQAYRDHELDIRNMVAEKLLRGKVELYISCEAAEGNAAMSINVPLLKLYKSQIDKMAQELEIEEPQDWYATLLRLPDALKSELNDNEVSDDEANALMETVVKAVNALIEFRTQEGARLERFFEEKVERIAQLLSDVEQFDAQRVEKIKARILSNLEQIEGMDYDKNRLEQELIFYIEKLDITEEKLRLQNHLHYFLETLHAEPGQGKKLGFIAQEMGREINTTGSKANHAEMQKVVVAMKDQLEQIKEQVLNVL